jgi:hypothetical protein
MIISKYHVIIFSIIYLNALSFLLHGLSLFIKASLPALLPFETFEHLGGMVWLNSCLQFSSRDSGIFSDVSMDSNSANHISQVKQRSDMILGINST